MNKSLQSLILSDMEIGDSGAQALAEALKVRRPNFYQSPLYYVPTRPCVFLIISSGCHFHPSIRYIRLVSLLSKQVNKALQELCLPGSRSIGLTGLKALAEALQVISTLPVLFQLVTKSDWDCMLSLRTDEESPGTPLDFGTHSNPSFVNMRGLFANFLYDMPLSRRAQR